MAHFTQRRNPVNYGGCRNGYKIDPSRSCPPDRSGGKITRPPRVAAIVLPVTGWQSGGDQGGWNPNQSFGPEAQTNRYDDPYNYGSDPYPGLQDQPQYGTGPYAGGGGYDPYQQQYPPTGGFPAPGYGPPPPPPRRSKLPMILSLVAIVIIVGAVVAIVLVNRTESTGQPTAQKDTTSTTTTKGNSSSTKSTSPTSGGQSGGDHADWIAIENAGLSYQVPADWQRSDGAVDSGLEVQFAGVANYGIYDCEGKNYVRTFAASGSVQGKDEKDLDLAATLVDFAKSFAAKGYSADSTVDVPTPTEVEVGDKSGMTVTAKVKVKVTIPNCQATDAEVAIVGVPVEEQGKPKGVAMLVVVSDVSGGPSGTKTLDPAVTQDILKTVKVG